MVIKARAYGPDARDESDPLPVEINLHNDLADAFGRLRVAAPHSLFDSKLIFDKAPLLWDEAIETGADIVSTHDPNQASVLLTSADATACKFTRQTFMRFNYQPGKSQAIYMTGNIGESGGGTDVLRRIGQFSDDNGVFFELDDTTMNVVVRSKVSGSVVDTKVPISSWNTDKLDGNGPSGIVVDWSKAQLFSIDYQWLGVGVVEFSVAGPNGGFQVVHAVENANILTGAYMSTPNLPLRYQMITTANSPVATMRAICSSVMSEGGVVELGIIRHASTSGVHLDANVIDTLYALIGIKLKSTHLGSIINIERLSLLSETNDSFEWVLVFNPDIAGSFVYGDLANSSIQFALGATANVATNGTIIDGAWVESKGSFETSPKGGDELRLGAAIDDTVDEFVLCVRPLSSNADIQGSITWRESV